MQQRSHVQIRRMCVSTCCANCISFNEPKETEESSESVETGDKGDHE